METEVMITESIESELQLYKDLDRMSRFLYEQPLLEWANRQPEFEGKSVDHKVAMTLLIERADALNHLSGIAEELSVRDAFAMIKAHAEQDAMELREDQVETLEVPWLATTSALIPVFFLFAGTLLYRLLIHPEWTEIQAFRSQWPLFLTGIFAMWIHYVSMKTFHGNEDG